MLIQRIYESKKLYMNELIVINDHDRYHYLHNVIRIKKGDSIIVFNNSKFNFYCKVIAIMPYKIILQVNQIKENKNESNVYLHLAQIISLNKKKMNFIIQKSTEMGINEITPIIIKKTHIITSNVIKKWKKISISSCQQCCRSIIPIINPPIELNKWLNQNHETDQKIIFYPHTQNKLINVKRKVKKIIIMVGNENGFSNLSIKKFKEYGFHDISIGKRILRMETAVIAAISVIQVRYGDF
ncbi:Ribosomal RNA small subunit methyltransferase E [Buchnera aphidicola (Thelaxes suberi)]|uniref:16S rRNA (uracil(1498)-N(3))-methyltransferase n=1 Tax=Buchnera aphidicola TaxID=9 RepID=UPI003463B379